MSGLLSHRASHLLVACAVALSACSSGGIPVLADPTDLIKSADFVDWENLPVPVSVQEVHQQTGSRGGMILPGSEPRRLLIAIWGNTCVPSVTVRAPDLPGPPQLKVSVAANPTHQGCGDILKVWPFEVVLTRDVDPASVVLEVMSQPS